MEVPLENFAAWLRSQGLRAEQIDWRPAWKIVALLLEADTKRNFEEAHAPDGTPWLPLAHPRPGSKGSDSPLRDNDFLMASLSAGGDGHVEEATEAAFTWGTNLEYARLQQEGGTIEPKDAAHLAIPLTLEAKRAGRARDFPAGRLFVLRDKDKNQLFLAERDGDQVTVHYILVDQVTIPARPFLGLNDTLLDKIEHVLIDHVLEQMSRS